MWSKPASAKRRTCSACRSESGPHGTETSARRGLTSPAGVVKIACQRGSAVSSGEQGQHRGERRRSARPAPVRLVETEGGERCIDLFACLRAVVAVAGMCLAAPALAVAVTFANSGTITIPAGAPAVTSGVADPYPSTIDVSGVTGTISNLTVTLT